MRVLCVIPARYGSTRFPGKPLVLIAGKPLIYWAWRSARDSKILDKIVVATDSPEIAEVVKKFGGDSVLTSQNHLTGTDRIAEVATKMNEYDVIVNLQGDQPQVPKTCIDALVSPFFSNSIPDMTTVAVPLKKESINDPNAVKVVTDLFGNALYFSRSPIPFIRQTGIVPAYHHIGLYAFNREFLLKYASLKPSPLELCEQLEQLRALENGYRVRVGIADAPAIEVNTPNDVEAAERWLIEKSNPVACSHE